MVGRGKTMTDEEKEAIEKLIEWQSLLEKE